ncbi:hypothetical protein AK812_SmicGene11763 [Symbiodinium microadriaticum]|uniref:Reverse transcriptase Ty1/copia-type domain-containing protein n=1 Tax=Symbiodinium microadriaticum TaxID=2951 RepID=A0A1Q9EC88_SYMMI|nr:hypothetical protein AK812_SmicGene11763 [Symbiodinium microadriaticum]
MWSDVVQRISIDNDTGQVIKRENFNGTETSKDLHRQLPVQVRSLRTVLVYKRVDGHPDPGQPLEQADRPEVDADQIPGEDSRLFDQRMKRSLDDVAGRTSDSRAPMRRSRVFGTWVADQVTEYGDKSKLPVMANPRDMQLFYKLESGDVVYYDGEIFGSFVALTKQSGKELTEKNFTADEVRLFNEAKKVEIGNLVSGNAIKFIRDRSKVEEIWKELPQRVMPSRFILTKKSQELGEGWKAKARWILLGHRDPDVMQLERFSPTPATTTVYLVFQLVSSLRYQLFIMDVTSAFGQSDPQVREQGPLYASLPKSGIPDEESWHLIEVLTAAYGLVNAPSAWRKTVVSVLTSLSYKESVFDPCLYYLPYQPDEVDSLDQRGCAGIVLLDVDDFAQGGNARHHQLMQRLRERFKFGKWRCLYNGHGEYLGRNYDKVTTLLLTNVRQPFSEELAGPTVRHVKAVNKTINELKKTATVYLRILPSDLNKGIWMSISDASVGNDAEKSQGGFIIAYADREIMNGGLQSFSINSWKSHRVRRVVKASLGSEALAMDDGLAELEWVKAMFTEVVIPNSTVSDGTRFGVDESAVVVRQQDPDENTILVTDARALYDLFHRRSGAAGLCRRAQIHVSVMAASAKALRAEVHWLPGVHMLADCLTKRLGNAALMRRVLGLGRYAIKEDGLLALSNLEKELSVGEAAVKDALRLFREIGDTDGEEAAQITLLDILCAKDGPAAGAATVSKERLAYYKTKGDKLGEGKALQKLAEQLMSSAKDEAAKYAKDAAALFVQAGDKKAQAAALQTAALAQSTDRVPAAEEALKISKSIGDEAGQVDLLTGLSAVLSGEAALARAQEAQALAKKLGDRSGEARAKHAAAVATLKLEKSSEALELAKEAASMLGEEKDTFSQACALRTAASAASAAEACELLREAVSLSAGSGDRTAEAAAKLQLAAALLAFEGPLASIFQNRTEAAAVAEQARVAFLLLGDKRSQGRASHLAAQSKILLDDLDGGVEAAMQAAVLGRSCGDRWLEACAMRTAVAGQVSKGCHAEALRMAKEVKSLFHKLGSSNIEEAMDSLIQQLEEVLPKIHPNPRVSVLPKDASINLQQNSIFTQATNCIVWSLPVSQLSYLMYCCELLKFVDDLKAIPDRIAFLVLTRGVMGRHTGEMMPAQYTGVLGTTVWAICRTIRLESPKLLVATVDVPNSATVHEMTDCIRAAQLDSGPRNEVSFIIDRNNQLGKRPY